MSPHGLYLGTCTTTRQIAANKLGVAVARVVLVGVMGATWIFGVAS